jgi:hypothetical protein
MEAKSWLDGTMRELIRDRIDVADLLREHGVELRRAGGNRHVALCPFHAERTPSFTLYSEGNYHCFGCGAHGDAIALVMRLRSLPFREAVAELAYRAGISLVGRRQPLAPTPRQRAVAQREAIFEELRVAWRERAQITSSVMGLPSLEQWALDYWLPDLADRELALIARFYWLAIEVRERRPA